MLYVIAMPSLPDDPDRYTARPLGAGDWFVWDTRRNAPVFGMDTLGEYQARVAARRLSQAYRRAMFTNDPPPTVRSATLFRPNGPQSSG